MPAEIGSNAFGVVAQLRARYAGALPSKSGVLRRSPARRRHLPSLELIWDGDGDQPQRRADRVPPLRQRSVVQGLVGEPPKTAWVIDYPLLERIHYLLVAGFDVFGNVGHQLTRACTWTFCAWRRGELLVFLPRDSRKAVRDYWYRDAPGDVKDYLDGASKHFSVETGRRIQDQGPAPELMRMMRTRLAPALSHKAALQQRPPSAAVRAALARLEALQGRTVSFVPQLTYLIVNDEDGAERFFTLLHNNAHSNISQLFKEEARRLPDEDTLTVLDGLVGAYPNAFYRMTAAGSTNSPRASAACAPTPTTGGSPHASPSARRTRSSGR